MAVGGNARSGLDNGNLLKAESVEGMVFVVKVGFGSEVRFKLLCGKKMDMTSAIGLAIVLEAFDVCLKIDESEAWRLFCARGVD